MEHIRSLADPLVGHAGDGSREPSHTFELFVIHAAADADFVRGYLLPALNLPAAQVLLIDALPLGGVIVSEIDRGVSRSRFTVAVLSPAYLADRWAEFGEQLASHLSTGDVRVIPLRLTSCELPLRLDARVSLDFTDQARWESETARLRDLLHTTAPAAEHLPCPYPGMRPFAEDDASRFFGRAHEIDDLVGRLDRGEHEIYVIGPSGSGKSSLVQAGLLHVLDAGSSRLGRSFVVRTMRPGERPADRLAKVLEGDLATTEATIEACLARRPPAERVLVFVDQLEELFTLASAAERQRFIAVVRTLRSVACCRLLLALRADFFGALLDCELGSDLAGHIVPLVIAPLRGAALAEAIRAPAMRMGVYLDARLSDRLVADAADEPGALPLVQETLRLLWDKRRQRLLGLAEYAALGNGGSGLGIAIARRADTTMTALTAAQQTIARRIVLRLVSFGEGRADTRRQQQIQALRSTADDDVELARVMQQLVEGRLITVDGSAADHGALADLSHEALITGWPALRQWIDRRRADEQHRRRLEAKVAEWIERGRGTVSLLDPVELSEAVQWMHSEAAHELGYGPELPSLVAASRSELDRRKQQRHRRTLRTVAAIALASLLVVVAWTQRREARRDAEAHRFLEQGRALLDEHPMQALVYLVAARAEGIESAELRALFGRASKNVPLLTIKGHLLVFPPPLGFQSSIFSRDGTLVVIGDQGKTVRLWDVTTGKPVTAPLEHQSVVTAAAVSRDGRWVVTASADKTARVWDATTGKPVRVWDVTTDKPMRVWGATTGKLVSAPLPHQSVVTSVTINADGTRVVTASWDTGAQLWDVTTGKPVAALLEHHSQITAAVFSSDDTRLLIASMGRVQVWDATTGQPVTALIGNRIVTGASFSPDDTRIVTANSNRAQVWDATTGQLMTTLIEPQSRITAAAFSPDGTRVVTASSYRAQVWDAMTGKLIIAPLEHQDVVIAAAFSPDGTHVITASQDKTARVWDATTGKPVTTPLEHQGDVIAMAFSLDGTRVVTASWDNTVRVWHAMVADPVTAPLEHRGDINGAAFSPDGTRVVTASEDTTARVWDATTGTPVTAPLEHKAYVTAAAFSPDGTRVVTASWDKTARVWDATTGNPVSAPLEHLRPVTAAAFSPDGTRLVTASWDKTARVWDPMTGNPVTAPLEHQGAVNAVAFSPDSTRVATASDDNTARVWNATAGNPMTAPLEHQGAVNAVAFSPEGTRVVTASDDKTARVWDSMTGKPVTAPLEHQGPVIAAAFSPDGSRVLTASWDNTARVWDAVTGQPLTAPLEHRDRVTAAAFSPDGTRVITASKDNLARLWDATTGKLVTAPLEHQRPVTAAAFSPDGTRVVTASQDETARVWTLSVEMGTLEDWRALARCSPFALVDGALMANPDPPTVCTALAKRTSSR